MMTQIELLEKPQQIEKRFQYSYYLSRLCCCAIKQIVLCFVQLIKLMSTITQSISQMATSIHVKDVLSFSLNAEYLHHNFNILKQCLVKLQEMEGSLGQEKNNLHAFSNRLSEVEKGLAASKKDHEGNSQKIRELQNNVGDQFMKKMYGIQEKTKNMFTFEDTVAKLEALDKFMTVQSYKQNEAKIITEMNQIKKLKNQFQRYVPNSIFNEFKESQGNLQALQDKKTEELRSQIKRIDGEILTLNQKVKETKKQSDQNGQMIKEINFPEMLQKNKKFKDEMDQKVNDLIIKMKKKVGNSELIALEQTIIEKLDKFLSDNEKSKAQKNETKDALLFLEKRITEIEDYIAEKTTEQEKDGLFTTKKIHCASCTKDLGKYEGKLGQYRPWSIFPCKELDPEKTGGFGYMSYLDKVQIKKGSLDDQAFDRLNKTAIQKDREHSPKRGSSTARGTNIISNYGSDQKGGVSLKDVYFRELRTEKGDRANSKFFRVKKQGVKHVSDLQRPKEI